ncbi:MAG TPA: hypothetical protein PKI14_05665 [Fervidobacterium sp.]|nr:hypothetical protein [Fervidobacterium sp.]HOQ40076.1 hypothetical protein [Fervidobacterium sp.]HPT54546.1 hypothetical protein [Fervidobacterium sp.]HPZ17945.1 hypothetical protein [Fervidobacterium sp.]HQE48415.1 hypothetical protein [Fervidobacterium sp.]
MENTDKVFSYVKYERELETEYRRKLSEAKRKSDVRKVFYEFLFKLLTKVQPDLPNYLQEDIKFDEKEFSYSFTGELERIINELSANSDLKAIIDRMFEVAKHRYMKIAQDEDVDYFRLNKSGY